MPIMNAIFHGVFGPCWTASGHCELYGKELNDVFHLCSMEKNNSMQSKRMLLLTLFHKVLHSGPGGEDHCLNGMVLILLQYRDPVWY